MKHYSQSRQQAGCLTLWEHLFLELVLDAVHHQLSLSYIFVVNDVLCWTSIFLWNRLRMKWLQWDGGRRLSQLLFAANPHLVRFNSEAAQNSLSFSLWEYQAQGDKRVYCKAWLLQLIYSVRKRYSEVLALT